MRIIFSRKGFDSTAGGGPSPIVDGCPLSLPIPDTKGLSRTTYGNLGLAGHAGKASSGKFGPDNFCHHDPMFLPDNKVILGQCNSSQGHLARQKVQAGDVFLFFGLFAEEKTGERHHRIFGWLEIEEILPLAKADEANPWIQRASRRDHPHLLGLHSANGNDTLYCGPGGIARNDSARLRLTVPGGPVSMWARPPWLGRGEITYFPDRDQNWPEGRLYRVGNGQEFVAPIGDRREPRQWLARIVEEIKA